MSLLRNRTELLSHQTEVSKRLHATSEDCVILILDEIYIFIQKSSNFTFQRISYSGHKHRNLIKPMMAVFPDGHIAAVWGPYPGNKSDALILQNLFKKK